MDNNSIKSEKTEKENYYQDVAFDYYTTKMALCGSDSKIKIFTKNNFDEGYEISSVWEVIFITINITYNVS